MQKKTKIVATISNLKCDVDFLLELYEAGMNVVRLNTAHMTTDDAQKVIDNVRAVSEHLAIMVDTKGPEIRTVPMDEGLPVTAGDLIDVRGDATGTSKPGLLCVSYNELATDVPVGSQLLIDDGDIALSVTGKTDTTLHCTVENDGTIKGRKSINIPDVTINLPALTEKDIAFVKYSAEQDVDFIAHSFVRKKEDVQAVQEILDAMGSDAKIIAKIENQEGLDNIDEILDHAFGAMIARGDLAIEIPAERIPLIQKRLVKKCVEKRKPVIIATQMLHSMIHAPRPTRAEVSDVGNACLDGTDAIMLSGETANGKYPLESVQTMARIALEVEESRSTFNDTPYTPENITTDYLTKAAVKAALRLPTKAIVADTLTGRTIRGLAAYRGENPIYAQCYSKRVMRELALSFGVHGSYMKLNQTTNEFLHEALTRLMARGAVSEEDLLVVLAGHFGATNGASFVEISTAKNLLTRA
ncbi:pyruvate kinase [Desulfoluna spongiiphila]|uniref:Pyruvate kinase n=1 Tax=Desulfoluna spongiiphila TaxID=419481 RepID=A0A1G5IXI3_9BACT|nr:pyruvate kinase [Desulfoluna spongiiphila]SCY80431.1 pyruvate kinase [Desulfoluna spongiiphila]VVS93286.1 pyruvate kinase [Desulfoluna spongiiphila]